MVKMLRGFRSLIGRKTESFRQALLPSMPETSEPHRPRIGIWSTKRLASIAAGRAAAVIVRNAIRTRGRARLLVATGNSQIDLIEQLAIEPDVDWTKVESLHLDEYVGLDADHPASFRRWIRERFAERVRPGAMHYIAADAPELSSELRGYAARLSSAPLDLAFVGIGENGHIAFNDPPVADFDDPLLVKRVTLDEACRRQQVNEGHFATLQDVPREAVTVTCRGLWRVDHWICCVPESRKAEAVKHALEGPVSTACPGSLVQRHPHADVFLDTDSAGLLDPDFVARRCEIHG